MPSSVPVDRVRIFNRTGQPLVEFKTSVERSWIIGDEGRAQFTYPSRKTDVVNEKVLEFGNWIYIQNDTLPKWVGVIDTPREWGGRDVTVSAFTPERVFGWRRGPLEILLKNSAGGIFRTLLGYVNTAEQTIIQAGDIWRGGKKRQMTVNPDPLNEVLQTLVERSKEEYGWRPVVDIKGNLRVYVDWSKRLGTKMSMLLQEGTGGGNIEYVSGNILIEDGPIINDVLGYSDGATWKDRITVTVRNRPSVQKYGLRQSSEQFDGVSSLTTLKNDAIDSLAYEPNQTVVLNALNVGETFQFLELGNRYLMRLQHIGFYTAPLGFEEIVRVIGMYYDPKNRNKLELTVVV